MLHQRRIPTVLGPYALKLFRWRKKCANLFAYCRVPGNQSGLELLYPGASFQSQYYLLKEYVELWNVSTGPAPGNISRVKTRQKEETWTPITRTFVSSGRLLPLIYQLSLQND